MICESPSKEGLYHKTVYRRMEFVPSRLLHSTHHLIHAYQWRNVCIEVSHFPLIFSIAGIAFILNLFVQCLLLYWKPDPTDALMFFAISYLFGAATSTLEFYMLSKYYIEILSN